MKFYLFDNIGARPMRGFRKRLRMWLLETGPRARPAANIILSTVLLWELVAPLLMVYCVRTLGLSLLVFHTFCWLLLDIDFLTCWCPTLLALMVDLRPLLAPGAAIEVLVDAWGAAPVRTSALLLYTAVQVVVSLSVYDLNPSRKELLPFSAYPMFQEAGCLFEEDRASALMFRVPPAAPALTPEPYYLRMAALSTGPSDKGFLYGAQALDSIEERMLIVAVPRKDTAGLGDETAAGLDHERECGAATGTVRLVCNVDAERAMPLIFSFLEIFTTMKPQDAWEPAKMHRLLQARSDVDSMLRQCPRSSASLQEFQLPRLPVA